MGAGDGSVTGNGAAVRAEDEALREQYGRALDEYRFQVDLNWRRSQYYFVLCAALLAASFTLLANGDRFAKGLVALAFASTVVITGLAVVASSTQHGYYRAARETKACLERRLGLGDFALQTTPGMGSGIGRRLGRVTSFQNATFFILALIGVIGFVTALNGSGRSPASGAGRVSVETTCQSIAPSSFDGGRSTSPGFRCSTTVRP